MEIKDIEDLRNIEFNHQIDIQIRFSDVDAFGHVNNAMQITYFDYGKIQYFDAVKFRFPEEDGSALIVVNVNVDFMEQIRLKDEIVVKTKICEIGHKSVKLVQVIEDKNNGHVKSVCRTVMCGYNAVNQESIVIPDKWRKLINTYEQYCPLPDDK
jgi:acyl-CoA thioester hydrolase